LKIFYNLFIRIYPFIAQLIGARNTKAKLWVDGRRNIFSNLTQAFSTNKSLVIWMHCSSLGEFEQGTDQYWNNSKAVILNIKYCSLFSLHRVTKFIKTMLLPIGYFICQWIMKKMPLNFSTLFSPN
jgi:hypothetical protein